MSLIAQLREPTRQQYFAYFAAWSGWVLDAFDFTIFLLVMPQIAKEYGVAHVATAGSIALTLLARLIGGWLAGAAADRWGRKLPLLISVIWFALCDGAVALVQIAQQVTGFEFQLMQFAQECEQRRGLAGDPVGRADLQCDTVGDAIVFPPFTRVWGGHVGPLRG